ncbi:hypothetical protein PENTCL1PPCAC_9125, partial [Pristionchus entomophagus]
SINLEIVKQMLTTAILIMIIHTVLSKFFSSSFSRCTERRTNNALILTGREMKARIVLIICIITIDSIWARN